MRKAVTLSPRKIVWCFYSLRNSQYFDKKFLPIYKVGAKTKGFKTAEKIIPFWFVKSFFEVMKIKMMVANSQNDPYIAPQVEWGMIFFESLTFHRIQSRIPFTRCITGSRMSANRFYKFNWYFITPGYCESCRM